MVPDSAAVAPPFAVVAILLFSVSSGPAVGLLDVTSVPQDPATESSDMNRIPGDGSAVIDVHSMPESVTIEPLRFSAGGARIHVEPSDIHVSDLSGHPMVVYKLRIPKLGIVGGTTTILNEDFTGHQNLTMRELSVSGHSELERTYRGELLVIKRVHEQDTVLRQQNVTVVVEQ